MIEVLPAPGQIWFKKKSKAAFCDIVDLYQDTPVSMRVGMKPIIENGGSQVSIVSQDDFLNNFVHVLDLHDWLHEFKKMNPGWQYPNETPPILIHQIWSKIGNPDLYVRVAQIGKPDGDIMSYYPVVKGCVQSKPIPFSKNGFKKEFRFCFSLTDILQEIMRQVKEINI